MKVDVKTFEKFIKALKSVSKESFSLPNLENGKPLLEISNQPKLSNQFYYILDVVDMKVLYISPGFWDLLGYEKQEITGAFLFAIIHPDDRELALKISVKALQISSTIEIMVPGEDVFVLDLRLKHKKGHYLRFMRQLGVNEVNQDNKPIQAFALWTDITSIKKAQLQEFSYQGPNDSKFTELKELTNKQNPFTQREQQVMTLTAEGLSTKLIADTLRISIETVNTHKKNMKQKTGITNSNQLLKYCIELGIV